MITDPLDMSRFESARSTDFVIQTFAPDGGAAIAVTARLESLSTRAETAGYEQYAMLFAGPAQPLLPQGTYRFCHDALGEIDLFLVPVGQNAERAQYEVCISRKLG